MWSVFKRHYVSNKEPSLILRAIVCLFLVVFPPTTRCITLRWRLGLVISRCFGAAHIQTARTCEMAIENKPREEFDTVFGQNESLELSWHHDYETTQPLIFKIIVIGDSNVGKTCLTYRFCGGTFLKNPEATIGVDFRERTLLLDGESIKVRGLTTPQCPAFWLRLASSNISERHMFVSGRREEPDLKLNVRHSQAPVVMAPFQNIGLSAPPPTWETHYPVI